VLLLLLRLMLLQQQCGYCHGCSSSAHALAFNKQSAVAAAAAVAAALLQ
jgi:hypothetical protein